MKKLRIFTLIFSVAGLLALIIKISYSVSNHRYNLKVTKFKETGKLDSDVKTSIEHKTFEKDGNSIHYFISGNPEGEAIVFLHPAFGDHRCFDKQIDYFSPRFRIITVDMFGHGLTGTGKSKEKIASTPHYIAEILSFENIHKTHIAGVSLGSLLAQDFALKYPEKTLSVTALGGYNINKEQKEIAKAQRNEMFKWLFMMIFSMDSFRQYVASICATDKIEQARFYESAKMFTRKSFTVMSGLDKLIGDRPYFQRPYPLLIVMGEQDLALAIQSARQWHTDDPSSELQIIENAGHCANMDNTGKFNETLMKFLTKNENSR